MTNTKDKGNITEAIVLAELIKRGKKVLLPFGDNLRYDLLIDNEDETFTRVQCKTARLLPGETNIEFASSSSQYQRGGERHGYKNQADVFAVYSPDTDKIYWVPVNEVGPTSVSLRLKPSKKNFGYIRWARDYEIDKVLKETGSSLRLSPGEGGFDSL